jgi:Domain of unknown function (DUF4386)
MTSTTSSHKPPMDATRKATLVAGLFYIATFVFSIPALGLYKGVLDDSDFVLGAGSDQGVLWGGLIEILTALTGIGTAVALYPVIRRHGPGRAIGFVASRTLEAAMIFTGVLAVLAVYTLRQDFTGGTDAAALTTTASALVAVKDWTFLLGPGLMPAINALCFATIMYQSRLVPRWIPTLGILGAPLLLLSSTATLFGGWEQVSSAALLLALPIAAWEFSVGVYMTVKGFKNPTAVSGDATMVGPAPVTLVNA